VVADIVGFSRLMDRDEEGTYAALRALRDEVIDPGIDSGGGRIVKHLGDGFLAEFPAVMAALRFAMSMQDEMRRRGEGVPPDQQIRFRIGINLGDIIVDDEGDIFGDGVNVAARLETLALPGGICVSAPVYGSVHKKLEAGFEDLGEQQVMSIPTPVRAYRLHWPGEERSSAKLTATTLATQSEVDNPSAWPARFFGELRRRHVLRMIAWYIIGGWVAIQVASEALPALNLDEQAIRYVWLAVLGGFPLALFFSWKYDVTAQGIRRTVGGGTVSTDDLRLAPTDYVLLLIMAALAFVGIYDLSHRALEETAMAEVAPETREINPRSIAVLPLENLSPETTERYFVTGMYDSLISNLGKINALQVTSRTSASRVNTSQGIPYIGRRLGVAHVIEGAVFREGNRVRISVKLIDTASDQHVWSETYERPFDDVMAIQASVARTVARIVQAKLTDQDEEQLARVLEIRPDTFESYLRAMFQYRKETQEGYQAGIEILEEALGNDPTSALAYAALGQGYSELVHSVLPKMEAMTRARTAVEKAVELDPTLAEAHLALALKQLYGDFDFEAARNSLHRAMDLNPSLSDAWYHWAWWLEMMGDDDEAIAAGEKTVELSPLSSFYIAWLAEQYRDAGDYDKAIELAESVIDLSPKYPVGWYALGNVYREQGRFDDAIAAHQKISHRPFWAFALGHTYAWAGQPEKALEVAAGYEHKPENAIPLTFIYAALGDVEKTLHWSAQAREHKLPWAVAFFSYFTAPRSLYKDPRIQAEAARYPTPLVPYPKG